MSHFNSPEHTGQEIFSTNIFEVRIDSFQAEKFDELTSIVMGSEPNIGESEDIGYFFTYSEGYERGEMFYLVNHSSDPMRPETIFTKHYPHGEQERVTVRRPYQSNDLGVIAEDPKTVMAAWTATPRKMREFVLPIPGYNIRPDEISLVYDIDFCDMNYKQLEGAANHTQIRVEELLTEFQDVILGEVKGRDSLCARVSMFIGRILPVDR